MARGPDDAQARGARIRHREKGRGGRDTRGASGLEVKKVDALRREQAAGDISRSAAIQAFNLPAGKPFSAPADNGVDRLVVRVTA